MTAMLSGVTKLFGRNGPGVFSFLGLILVVGAFFPKELTRNQLQLVEGDVSNALAVLDRHDQVSKIEFSLKGSKVRYWTDRTPPELLSATPNNVHVLFYAEPRSETSDAVLSRSVKTYGLSVNGREIISVETYLEGEWAFRQFVMAPLGAVFLVTSLTVWFYRHRRM
jgi:hypothetical protein